MVSDGEIGTGIRSDSERIKGTVTSRSKDRASDNLHQEGDTATERE